MVTLITNDNLTFTKSKCNCGISVNKKNKKSKSLKSLNKSRKTRKNKNKKQN